jgi:hypothetical protein
MQNQAIVNVYLSQISNIHIDYDTTCIVIYLTPDTNEKSDIIKDIRYLTSSKKYKFIFNSIPDNIKQLFTNTDTNTKHLTVYSFKSFIPNAVAIIKHITNDTLTLDKDSIYSVAQIVGDVKLTNDEIKLFTALY